MRRVLPLAALLAATAAIGAGGAVIFVQRFGDVGGTSPGLASGSVLAKSARGAMTGAAVTSLRSIDDARTVLGLTAEQTVAWVAVIDETKAQIAAIYRQVPNGGRSPLLDLILDLEVHTTVRGVDVDTAERIESFRHNVRDDAGTTIASREASVRQLGRRRLRSLLNASQVERFDAIEVFPLFGVSLGRWIFGLEAELLGRDNQTGDDAGQVEGAGPR